MKEKMAKFLFSRIETKISQIDGLSSYEDLTMITDDIGEYLDALKEIIFEVVKP
ncbi:hypothetical protein HPK19_07395 [Arthrobacter citreus]|nr:hypothetical protein HPK19_07395 [Arthrobacter citreus]